VASRVRPLGTPRQLGKGVGDDTATFFTLSAGIAGSHRVSEREFLEMENAVKNQSPISKRRARMVLPLAAAVPFVPAGSANADQTIFDTSPPYRFDSSSGTVTYPVEQGEVNEAYIVGFGTYDTVNGDPANNYFLDPTAVTFTWTTDSSWQGDMYVYNASTVNVNGGDPADLTNSPGGYIGGTLYVCGTSAVNVSGQGTIYSLEAYDQSIITVNGGTIGLPNANGRTTGILELSNDSSATINDGTISDLIATANSTVTINKGNLVAVSAGSSDDPYLGDSGTHVLITGGDVTGPAGCSNGAALNITGGRFTSVGASNGGNVILNGGTLSEALVASGNSVLPTTSTVTLVSGSADSLQVGTTGGASASISMIDGQVNGIAITQGAASSLVVSGGAISGNVDATSQSFISLQGGTIGGQASEEQSTLDISGNCMIGGVTITDGQANMSGGTVTGNLITSGGAVLTLTGGKIQENLYIQDQTAAFMSGGSVAGQTSTSVVSNLFMTGGTTANMQSISSSAITMSGGSCSGTINALNSSTINFSGTATVAGALSARNSSFLYINGGEMDGGVYAYNTSTVVYSGGIILGGLNIYDSAHVTLAGGNPGPTGNIRPLGASAQIRSAAASSPVPIYLNDNSSLEVDGINLSTTLLDANNNGVYSEYQVNGYFGDGTPIASGADFYVQNPAGSATGASFALVATPQLWNVNTGGSWSYAANWLPNIVADGPGAIANFNSATAPATVALDGDRTVGALNFGGSNSYTIVQGSGGTLYLDNQGAGANISVTGEHQILAPVTALDNTLIDVEYSYDPATDQTSNSSLTLAGGITVASGKQLSIIERGGEPSSTAFVRGGSLKILAGTLAIIPNGTPAGTSTIDSLALCGGTLDLTNNDLIVSDSTQFSSIQSAITSAYDGGAWDMPGITSSSAAAKPNQYGLGYATAGAVNLSTFDGQSVSSGTTLVKYTLLGDALLTGTVGLGDFNRVLANFNTGTLWSQGAFHPGSNTGLADYNAVVANFNATASGSVAVGPALKSAASPSLKTAALSFSPDAATDLKLEVNTVTGDVYALATATTALTGYDIFDKSGNLLDSGDPNTDLNERLLSQPSTTTLGNQTTFRNATNYKLWATILDNTSTLAEGSNNGKLKQGTASTYDTINIPANGTIDFGDIYNTVAHNNDITFAFSEADPTNAGNPVTGSTYNGEVDYVGNTVMPEPGMLGVLGLGGTLMMRRRRTRR